MIAEISIFPIGSGIHLSKAVSDVIRKVQQSGLDYELGPMGTVIEGPAVQVFELIKSCHLLMKKKHKRVYTTVKIDDHGRRVKRMRAKVTSVERKLKRS